MRFAISFGAAFAALSAAQIIGADFNSELDPPVCCAFFGPRVLENPGQTVQNAGPEMDGSHETADPSGWSDALEVDLDPSSYIVTLTPTGIDEYEIITIDITSIVFDGPEQVIAFAPLSVDNAVPSEWLSTSFGPDSLNVTYDSRAFGPFEFGDGSDTFQIRVGPLDGGSAEVPVPAALPLLAGAIAVFGLIRRRA